MPGVRRLAERHRATVMAARTLMQQAVPTTFGLKAAGWLVGLARGARAARARPAPAQLGGAAGTLALLGDRGLDVLAATRAELELAEPALPWHASRGPVRGLVAALAMAAAACGKIALDVVLLAQTEVAEVRVGDGASSTMPHKRNPVAPILAQACARAGSARSRRRSREHEHERAAGAWHAEWEALSDALALTGGAAFHLRRTLDGLEVDAERMRVNLRPETSSESGGELGSADAFVDRALARFRAELA